MNNFVIEWQKAVDDNIQKTKIDVPDWVLLGRSGKRIKWLRFMSHLYMRESGYNWDEVWELDRFGEALHNMRQISD